MGGADGTEGARQHQGQQEMGLGQARQGYTAVRTDSDFGSASSLPSNASGALSVQSGRGQSLPQGLGQEGIRDKLTGGGSLTPQVPPGTASACWRMFAIACPPASPLVVWCSTLRGNVPTQDPPGTAHTMAAGSVWQLVLHRSAVCRR